VEDVVCSSFMLVEVRVYSLIEKGRDVCFNKLAHTTLLLFQDGVMKTHDEETKKFFKHSGVRCVLAARYGDSKLSWFRQQVVGTLYSHHQKLMIVDSPGPRNMRKLTSFIGGLDLCDGRWDTPLHHLFNSLQNEHKDDFYNKSFPVSFYCFSIT
jgi:phospholipase D1/2